MGFASQQPVSEDRRAVSPPLPPAEMRRLVCHDDYLFDLSEDGALVFPYVDANLYRSVFDFGCGCGRVARQLLVQNPRPERYVGIDIHRGMIEWCQANLSPIDPVFHFYHHDVWNPGLGPDNTRQLTAPFPAGPAEFSLVNAHSVFTHLFKEQSEFYLEETARILTDDGIARTTWFLFDRATFPMLFDFQVSLFINEIDCSNAVIYDWKWLLEALSGRKLRVVHTVPPSIRGHQWELYLQKSDGGERHCFPLDVANRSMMCGSGVSPSKRDSEPVELDIRVPDQLDTEVRPTLPRHQLHFSGTIGVEEFDARCRENPWWYHSYYFDNGFSVRGDYDVGDGIAGYGFPESLEGMRVLDIGTGAGWFAFYFEQLGADVVTVDARGYCDFDIYGRPSYPAVDWKGRLPDRIEADGTPVYFSPVSRSFWIMKDILGSRVRHINARVYDIGPALFDGQKFDLVFLGSVLGHLRDPIGALMAARRVCRHRVIAAAPVVEGEKEPNTLPCQYLPHTQVDRISWWVPNEACFRHWFLAAGFVGVDVSQQVTLRSDVLRTKGGRPANGDQILRVGSAFVP